MQRAFSLLLPAFFLLCISNVQVNGSFIPLPTPLEPQTDSISCAALEPGIPRLRPQSCQIDIDRFIIEHRKQDYLTLTHATNKDQKFLECPSKTPFADCLMVIDYEPRPPLPVTVLNMGLGTLARRLSKICVGYEGVNGGRTSFYSGYAWITLGPSYGYSNSSVSTNGTLGGLDSPGNLTGPGESLPDQIS